MGYKWLFVTSGLLFVQLIHPCVGQIYKSFELQGRCNETFTLPCPSREKSSLGTLVIKNLQKDCRINLKLQERCDSSRIQTFAFYFAFTRVSLSPAGSLRIFEYDDWGAPGLIKNLTGSQTAGGNLQNAGQVLTQYSLRPTVTLEYFHESDSGQSAVVLMDYLIVEELGWAQKSYCFALSGYVNTKLICEERSLRVNCPSRYSAVVDRANPAYGRQYCQEEKKNGEADLSKNGGSPARGLVSSTSIALTLNIAFAAWTALFPSA